MQDVPSLVENLVLYSVVHVVNDSNGGASSGAEYRVMGKSGNYSVKAPRNSIF